LKQGINCNTDFIYHSEKSKHVIHINRNGFSSFKIGISTMALAKTYQITIHEISGNHFFSGIKTKNRHKNAPAI
jgi:hypothetical protein